MLKQIHAEMGGIENVEKLMGESEDARAYQRQISEMLGGQMSNQDEDEVEDELEALEKEVRGVEEAEEEVEEAQEEVEEVQEEEESVVDYPAAPEAELHPAQVPTRSASQRKARAKERAREAGSAQVSEPMLA